jgi:hypothetical protein
LFNLNGGRILDKIVMVLGAILTCATLNGMSKEGKRLRVESVRKTDRVVRQTREEVNRMVDEAIAAANADARFTEALIQTLLTPDLSGPQKAHIRRSVTNNFLDAQDARIRASILNQ